jgi:predicted metal-binding membrane protein
VTVGVAPRARSTTRGAPSPGTIALAGTLAAITALAWRAVLRDASDMAMPGTSPSLLEGAAFTAQWGVMMAAMMLPSAAPMILLYRTVRARLSTQGERAVPAWAFAAVYLALWLAVGVPVYGGYVAVGAALARWPRLDGVAPYAVAAILAAAGLYQFGEAKRVCLRACESPLDFLMRRWRAGHAASLALAARHAGYCLGCCWALMAILVAAGAMSIPWVVSITLVVFAEKVLPWGERTARVVGVGLIALGVAVALRPSLALTMRGSGAPMGAHEMMMPRPMGAGAR